MLNHLKFTIIAASSVLLASAAQADSQTVTHVKAGSIGELSIPLSSTEKFEGIVSLDGKFWNITSASNGKILVKAYKSDVCVDIFVFTSEKRHAHRVCS